MGVYVLKYKIEFKTRATGAGRGLNGAVAKDGVFEIEQLDPLNNDVYFFKSATAPIIEQIPDTENKDFQLISTKCIVNIKNTNAFSKLINFVTDDERKFRGTLKLDGAVKFKGWLLTDLSSTNEIFNAKVSDLQLTFSDGIGTLENQEYRDSSDRKLYGKATIIEILSNINRITGLGLNLVAAGNFSSPALSGRVLEKQKISQLRFFNPDRTPFSCKKILEQLCTKDFAHFFQKDGAFWFVPFSQYRKSTRVYNLYNNAGVYQSDITESTYKMVGDGEDVDLASGTAQRYFNAPYKRVSLSTKFNQTLLFENEQLEYYTAGASEPIVLSTLLGVDTQENNISFSGWTTIGTLKCSLLTFSDEYMGTLKASWDSLDGTRQYGGFPYNNKVLVINKATSTAGAGLLSSKSQIRKGTEINFSVPYGHSLKQASVWQVNNLAFKVFVETKEGEKWYLFENGEWHVFGLGRLRLQRGNFKFYVDSNPSPTQQDNTLAGLNATNTQNLVISANYNSQPCPVDGYLQILIEPFFYPTYSSDSQHGDLFQFHPPVVTIIKLPKGIDEVTYESTITGKHTVVAPKQDMYFCDNSLDLIPCSVYDATNVETSQYTLDSIVAEHMLLLPLLEKQVQFSRSFLKVQLECFSHTLQVGDVMKFDASGFSDMAGMEFVVCSIQNRDYRTAQMRVTAYEIVESASNISYDIFIYNEGVKESIRRNVPYSTTPTSTALEPPWFWVDIPSNYFTFSITGIDENSSNGGVSRAWFSLNATSGVINWGDGSSSTLVNGVNQHNYATTGPRYISVSNIVGGTILSFNGGSNNVSAFNVSLLTSLTSLNAQNNKLTGAIPGFSNNASLQYLILTNNQLTGTIPSFASNTSLVWLYLPNNQLTGTIPNFNANTGLTEIQLNNNQLTGNIPSFASNIQVVSLYNNLLSGTIPSFSSNTNLTALYLNSNLLSGTIPSFSSNTNLTVLQLNFNQLSGTVPSFSSNTKLRILALNTNQLTGFSGGFGLNIANSNAYDFANNLLTQGSVDSILASYKTISTLGSGDSLQTNGTGNATPSATGLTDKGIIQATGATCTTN